MISRCGGHYRHEHPSRTVALRTRSRLFGILNFAVALRGRSCGWGTCERPRRTFVGRSPGIARNLPWFVELVTDGADVNAPTRVLWRIGGRA